MKKKDIFGLLSRVFMQKIDVIRLLFYKIVTHKNGLTLEEKTFNDCDAKTFSLND